MTALLESIDLLIQTITDLQVAVCNAHDASQAHLSLVKVIQINPDDPTNGNNAILENEE